MFKNSKWVHWFGGECPVADTSTVKCIMRGAVKENGIWDRVNAPRYAASQINWSHTGANTDILAYRLVTSITQNPPNHSRPRQRSNFDRSMGTLQNIRTLAMRLADAVCNDSPLPITQALALKILKLGKAHESWVNKPPVRESSIPVHGGYLGKVQVRRVRDCRACSGDGIEEIQSGPYTRTCSRCNGSCVEPSSVIDEDALSKSKIPLK